MFVNKNVCAKKQNAYKKKKTRHCCDIKASPMNNTLKEMSLVKWQCRFVLPPSPPSLWAASIALAGLLALSIQSKKPLVTTYQRKRKPRTGRFHYKNIALPRPSGTNKKCKSCDEIKICYDWINSNMNTDAVN